MEASTFLQNLIDDKTRYMFLGRLQMDAISYTYNYPNPAKAYNRHLWSENTKQHITDMKYLFNAVPETPEWISMDDILSFEKQMTEIEAILQNEN